MKALVYTGPHALECRDEAEPLPGNDEVLVRVEAVGICGSDMHAYHGHDSPRPAPLVLGHEAAGRIAGRPNRRRRAGRKPPANRGFFGAPAKGAPPPFAPRRLHSLPPPPRALT